ncbi:SDR family oxidoreductase [Aquincola sp. S2]|uniref:SDR family oxidoreductase n=1 Tax=Pseudaquabacterium terrae TaxID=2732868 RepID=A0ABX2ERV9_9BURK|nr:SDR family oxidoreductase [Aquabacterium terrae]NRF71333.1 SDR family oxidoreductase [Aquabacterium terrae]
MNIQGKVAIITGGASGIGAGLAERLAADGARGIVVADLQQALADSVASKINADGRSRAIAVRCDVSVESDIQALVAATRARFGQVDIYISNAGIGGVTGGFELEDAVWERMWKIHVMAHVWAARVVVPEMVARGEGGFVVTASAAGLLNIVETAPYGVTKHASVAFAEWLRIGYGRRGVRVSCLCPQGVATAMTADGAGSAGVDGMLQPSQVADCVTQALRDETFLVLPHPEVLDYLRGKTTDYARWLGGMQKLYARQVLGEGK